MVGAILSLPQVQRALIIFPSRHKNILISCLRIGISTSGFEVTESSQFYNDIDATANRMGITPDKVMMNIENYGNTTAATIPLCLWDYEKQLKKGDNLILAAFGGGFTWGSIYLKWAYDPK